MKSKRIVITQTTDASVRGQDLTNKYVVLMDKYYRGDEVRRVFKCEGGFGCSPDTIGSAVMGTMIYSGEKFRAERFEVGRMATEEEVKQAEEIREKTKKLLIEFTFHEVQGFKLFTGEEWSTYINKLQKEFEFPYKHYTAAGGSFFLIDTQDYLSHVEIKEITETEFYVLNKIFQGGYGDFVYIAEER